MDLIYKKDPQLSVIAILIVTASIIMLFGTIISSLYVLKVRTQVPFTLNSEALLLGLVNTVILIFSSLSYQKYAKVFNTRQWGSYGIWLLLTIGCGILFLAGQSWLWYNLTSVGSGILAGQLSAIFYLITGLHGIHIISGLLALCWLYATNTSNETHHHTRIRTVGIFWHFLTILWILLYIVIILQ